MTINERVRYFRKEVLHMNQTEFANSIGMKQTGVSSFEKEGATVSEQTIKTICSVFNIREEWLRNGTEPMREEPETFSLDDFAKTHGVSDLELKILKTYFRIDPDARKDLLRYFKKTFIDSDGVPDTPEELEAMYPPVKKGEENAG